MIRRLVVSAFSKSSKYLLAKSYGYRRVLSDSIDEQSTVQLIKDYYRNPSCSDVKVIMDVGANVGQSAAKFMRLFPNSRIYSLEPALDVFKKLSSNVESNKAVTPLNYAASNEDASVKLYHSEISAASSLESPWRGTGTWELVSTRRLDTLCRELDIKKLNILKIDTEGHDLIVLRGAEGMLAGRAVDIIIVECGFKANDLCHSNFYEVASYLKRFDFNLSGFTETYNCEWNDSFVLLYCNAIFARSS